ncbi:dihydrofolate reductase family protein [Streptomyces sp. NPDC002889]|uniref:dihydrofolate reductase family protein n=1 Tax=Streptomyces sp. NPDC002889 TaxID=3364669 RepID=UPI0036BFFF7D
MRDLIITENITLDGVIDASEGWFDPAGAGAEGDRSDLEAALREQMAAADAFLVGRVTFEEMRGYWPKRTDDTTGVSAYLNTVSKYVVSRTLDDPAWEHTTVLRGDLAEEVRALKSAPGQDIVTTGSMTLTAGLIAAGLVDEYRLFVHPVVLGRGRQLFSDTTGVRKLRLAETRPFTSGIVLLRYRTAQRPDAGAAA